jgi:putative endonuclease
MKGGFVYILASKSGVLYTGVTSNLDLRIVEHRLKLTEGFTKKYSVTRLVYYERFGDIRQAIAREKQIKGWLRAKKIALIESANPKWKDLAEDHFPSNPPNPPPS